MNNKGFAISGVIYSMIVLFLMLMLLIFIVQLGLPLYIHLKHIHILQVI